MKLFQLHERLRADSVEVTRLALNRVLLIRDRAYPWLVLVPEREGLRDFHDLAESDRMPMMSEIDRVSRVLVSLFQPDKMNVAALGNMVPQLHVHVIARFKTDPAWPGPIWGVQSMQDYAETERAGLLSRLRAEMADHD